MKIVQFILDPYDKPISGADLRNEAIFQSLRQLGQARQIALGAVDGMGAQMGVDPIEAAFGAAPPDLIVVEGVWLFAQAKRAKAAYPNAKIVFDFHNVESALRRALDRARFAKPLRGAAPIFYAKRWRKAVQLDRDALHLADGVWLCSKQDQILAQSLVRKPPPMAVVPNIAPLWCDGQGAKTARSAPLRPVILYLGHLGYAPNKLALRRLTKAIMPPLLRRFPKAELIVAGRNPNSRLRRFLARFAYVELIADPAALAPIYQRADMTVLPLHEGGGSRIKVLEALALGCPIIATAKAVEGLELIPGTHFLLAETAPQFTANAARLIQDPALNADLIAAGRSFVQAHHSITAMARAIDGAVSQMR
ncbi:MAG: glycosyltransferase family 4 protein [Paracoccaceae bacterium]